MKNLTEPQRAAYYGDVCKSLGLNPLTRPFDFITLNGKLQLYARKDCTEQLRRNHSISLQIVGRDTIDGVHVVTARATMPNGRIDESVGAVPVGQLKGELLANAFMKAETKAKRRVTLSICGLGLTDESEVESIQPEASKASQDAAKSQPVAAITGKVAVGLATEATLKEIIEARPAWLRSQGVDPADKEAVRAFWGEKLRSKYNAATATELLERDAKELLAELQTVGHRQEIAEVFASTTAPS